MLTLFVQVINHMSLDKQIYVVLSGTIVTWQISCRKSQRSQKILCVLVLEERKAMIECYETETSYSSTKKRRATVNWISM